MKIAKTIVTVRRKKEERINPVDNDLNNIIFALQGNLRFGDAVDGENGENVSGVWVSYTTNASANTEDAVSHSLGSEPIGFIVTNIDKGGVVYDSGTSWTDTTIYLKCSVASANVTLFLLN